MTSSGERNFSHRYEDVRDENVIEGLSFDGSRKRME